MKWISFLSLLPVSSLAFQQVATTPIRHAVESKTSLKYFAESFHRAEECATHYGFCSPKELEDLADELEAFTAAEEMLGLDPRANQDTKRVQDLITAQMELKDAMTDYVNDHHEETFDMSDV